MWRRVAQTRNATRASLFCYSVALTPRYTPTNFVRTAAAAGWLVFRTYSLHPARDIGRACVHAAALVVQYQSRGLVDWYRICADSPVTQFIRMVIATHANNYHNLHQGAISTRMWYRRYRADISSQNPSTILRDKKFRSKVQGWFKNVRRETGTNCDMHQLFVHYNISATHSRVYPSYNRTFFTALLTQPSRPDPARLPPSSRLNPLLPC